MFSLWILLLYVMADVMPRGHGGDGSEDPPHPGGFGRGSHETDAVPPRKRGKATNRKLAKAVARNGGPLSLPFDRDATFVPVGELSDMFIREVGLYMWANVAFDRRSWSNVSEAEQNALHEHMAKSFNFDEVNADLQANELKGGIRAVYLKRFRDRKSEAKDEFINSGGYGDLERARAHTPEGMTEENWRKTIEYFLTPKYIAQSIANKENRKKQEYTNRGGTASYSSFSYKKDLDRVETYKHAHTKKDGVFDGTLAEKRYKKLREEFDSRSKQLDNEDQLEESVPVRTDVEIFDDVMGARRGYIKGIGRRPSSSKSKSGFVHQQLDQSPPSFTKEQISGFFQNPNFKQEFFQWLSQQNLSNNAAEDETDEEEE